MKATYDAIVVGSGLAGLSAAFHLAEARKKTLVIEAASQVGGRTSNWKSNGMDVESGIHKYVGVYKEFPALLKAAGLNLEDVFEYHDQLEMRVAEGGDRNSDPQRRRRSGWFGLSLFRRPLATIGGALGNWDLLSFWDKWKFVRIVVGGLWKYLTDPEPLDQTSIAEFARKRGASDNLVNTAFFSLSGGLFFLPPERYSAHAFFSLFWASTKRSYASRLAIFRGGMTDVMAKPIMDAILERGGDVRLDTTIERILFEGQKVVGVATKREEFRAPKVVVATQIGPAKKIVAASYRDHSPKDAQLQKLLTIPDMPGVAVQLELESPAERDDHVVFGPNSILGTFGEQSHTTFSHSKGRISTFLSPSEPFMAMPDGEVVDAVVRDLKRQGVDVADRIRQSVVVRHPSEFYLMEPGSESKRPRQRTTVPGLALAGDYTKQPLICTMEGAVISGRLAAEALLHGRE